MIGWISFVIITAEAVLVVLAAYTTRADHPSFEIQERSGQGPWFSSTITQGSGFFINASSEILTNRHVVESCRRISVAGAGFHGVRGKVMAISDAFDRDLAIVRIGRIGRVPGGGVGGGHRGGTG